MPGFGPDENSFKVKVNYFHCDTANHIAIAIQHCYYNIGISNIRHPYFLT